MFMDDVTSQESINNNNNYNNNTLEAEGRYAEHPLTATAMPPLH